MIHFRWAFIIATTWATAFASWADESTMLNEPPVVSNKQFETAGRFELSVFPYDFSFRNRYVTHSYAAHLALGYHFLDSLGVEAFGGYVFKNGDTQTTEILKAVAVTQDFRLAGLWRTKWFGGADILWSPFYGKFSIVSEVEGSFQLYLLGGLGVDGLERPVNNVMMSTTRLSGNVGLGLRVFVLPSLAVRAEIRENIGRNTDLVGGSEGSITPYTWCQLGVSLFL